MSTKETSADKTKYRLAEAAKKCMASSGTDAMTVTQIVQTCGVTRQTFYRNFQDKYDLINWYFDKLLLESFAQMGDGDRKSTRLNSSHTRPSRMPSSA